MRVGVRGWVFAQMCWEEKFVTGYNIPSLLVVGWEGFFGLFAIHVLITIVGQVPSCLPTAAIPMENPCCSCKLTPSSARCTISPRSCPTCRTSLRPAVRRVVRRALLRPEEATRRGAPLCCPPPSPPPELIRLVMLGGDGEKRFAR